MAPRVSTPVLKTTELQTTMREGSTPPTPPSEKHNSHPDVLADGVYNVHSRPQRSLYDQDLGGMEEPKTIGFLIWALITTLTVLVFILRLLARMNHRCCAHNIAEAADQLDAWSHTTVQPGTETHTTVQPGSETHATVQPGTETHATVQAGTETHATVQPGSETHVTVQPGTETRATVQPGTETHTTVQPGSETHATVQPGTETHATVQAGTETHATVQPGSETHVTVQPGTETRATVQPGTETHSTLQPETPKLIPFLMNQHTPPSQATTPSITPSTTSSTAPLLPPESISDRTRSKSKKKLAL
ncbi:glutamine-rich protein 2-like [Saccostrea echinata]|uniref:glutamine-rich protein 2-like n=1 Tax=Saccostrea echinata TaxID=191078 RepID=UPI002A83584B|nr:glutamine-rich protein 2-like [Saccostrea echinata]